MLRSGLISLAILSLAFSAEALAAVAPVAVKPQATFTSGATTCGKIKGKWTPGRVLKSKKFVTLSEDIRVTKLNLARASGKTKTTLKKKLAALQLSLKKGKPICAAGPKPPTPTPTAPPNATPSPTATPTPIPDQLSLEPYTGPVTRDLVQYLLQKAGYGLSSKEEPIVQAALSTGLDSAVTEFMRIKAEPTTLADRFRDRFDRTLGNLNTQSRNNFSTQGFRQAVLDYAINTNNPYRENLRHFFLSLWTVGAEVLNNNSANNPQIPLWMDYWDLLGQIANGPNLPDNLISIGRHPFMLIYLNNDQNLNGNVNENFARELQELFSLGTTRVDAATGQILDNYVEYRNNGQRSEGDIYRIATRLSGWRVSPLLGGDGLLYWRSVYSAADHDPTPRTIYEGTPFAFSAQTDEDVVRGIYANHPAAPDYIARRLLQYYLAVEPPQALIHSFGQLIKAANYQLDGPMATLFKSKAFYHQDYRKMLAKDSFQFAVEMTRVLELARNDIGVADQEVGANVVNRETDLSAMGYITTNPPTVFFFPVSTWTSSPTLMASANYVANLITDSTATGRLTGWTPQSVLPSGDLTEAQVISSVAARLGITPNSDQVPQLAYYLDNTYNGATYTRAKYDNTLASFRGNKAMYLYVILSLQPDYVMK